MANQELCERQGFTVRGLPVGEKINFRVVAVNIAGRSPPAVLSQPVTIREIMGESVRTGCEQTRVKEHLFYGLYLMPSYSVFVLVMVYIDRCLMLAWYSTVYFN